MPIYLKQSTASQEIPLGYFVDSTDGNTEETGLTIANTAIKIWKAGATTLANKTSGGATHISNGIYYAVLDATDTNTLGSLIVFCHVTGALAVRVECVVLAANVYDSIIGGGDLLDVNTSQLGGTSQTGRDIGASVLLSSGTGAGQVSLSSGTVTVGTNNDKTGYSLTQTFPANFSDLAITATTGLVTVGTNNDKTGYSLTQTFPTNFADLSITATTGRVAVGTNNDKTGYSLTQTFPTNFADLSITATTGLVTVGTNNDKTGYSLTQTFPTNFSDLAITATTGRVAVGTNNDKTGYSIADATSDAVIADAVWNAATATYGAAGSYGEKLEAQNTASVTVTTNNDKTGYSISGTKTTLDALNDVSTAQVNAEVVDALATDTYAEPGQAAPAATTSLAAKINYLYKWRRNKTDNNGTVINYYADDGTTVDQKQSVSEAAGTVTKEEMGTGP